MIERAVQVHLASFLTKNAVLSEHQSGFRKRHSTKTAVPNLSGYILERMDKQIMTVRGLGHDLFKKYLRGITHTQGVKYECNLSSSPTLCCYNNISFLEVRSINTRILHRCN